MARRKDDPLLKQLFDGPPRSAGATPQDEDPRRDALRREVLDIIDAAGASTAAEPLDDGLISAYLDGALPDDEQAALEARLASSHALREQVSAAALAREAALDSGLSMPPALAAAYDEVPAPKARAVAPADPDRRVGVLGRLFGTPAPARRWLAAAVPVLAAVVVVAVIAPDLMRDEQVPASAVSADANPSERAREAEARKEARKQPAEKKTRAAEAAKPKKVERRMAGRRDRKASEKAVGGSAVLSTTLVPLNAELRNAVVALGRSQARANYLRSKGDLGKSKDRALAKPKAKPQSKPQSKPVPPAAGAKQESSKRRAARQPGDGSGSQRPGGITQRQLAVIGKAISPGCPNDPSACCTGHRVDRNLLDRLVAGKPPLQSVKVLHLASRACYLTLP